jgi:hypothetical protein
LEPQQEKRHGTEGDCDCGSQQKRRPEASRRGGDRQGEPSKPVNREGCKRGMSCGNRCGDRSDEAQGAERGYVDIQEAGDG